MKVSALEEYGLRCMILLARCEKAEVSLTIPEISEKERLSLPYIGKLLMILKRSGLVRAIRGRRGGYTLSKPAATIFLREIFNALGEPVYGPNHCERFHAEDGNCVHSGDCTVRAIWAKFNEYMNDYYDNTTLADLAFGIEGLSLVAKENPERIAIEKKDLVFRQKA
jgi:Rrf2 family protein